MKHLRVGWTSAATILLLLCSALGTGMLLLSYHDSHSAGPLQNLGLPAETQLEVVNTTANHFPDGGFEEWSNPYYLSYVDEAAQTRERYSWYASSPWPVSEGSYSGGLQCRARDDTVPTAAYLRQYITGYAKNMTIGFDWWLDDNPDPSPYGCYVYVEAYFNTGRRIQYYLSGAGASSNYSTLGVFLLGGAEDTWNGFSRNVTEDYLSIASFGGVLPEVFYVTSFGIYAFATTTTGDFLRVFIDDVRITNGTTTYIGGSTHDGNFETHATYEWWEFNTDSGYGIQTRSSLAHSGSWSLNHTVLPDGNQSYAFLLNRAMIRLSETNPGILGLWYNIPEWNWASQYTYSYIEFEIDAESQNYYAYYSICSGGGDLPFGNESTQAHFSPLGYNQTGQWIYMERNLWEDLSAYFGLEDIMINWMAIWTFAQQRGTYLTVLIDDLSLSSAFLNDGGYEDQGSSGSRIQGYQSSDWAFGDFAHLTVTATSYAGAKAANLTLPQSYGFSCLHSMSYQTFCWNSYPALGTEQIYLDAQWRLEDAIDIAVGYARIRVGTMDGRSLSYIFSRNLADGLTNTTTDGSISLEDLNTEGTWIYMHRDLVHDYEAIFGFTPNTRISHVYLEALTAAGDTLALLLDDVYVYTDSPPRITGVSRTPASPEYVENVSVSADITDISVDNVLTHYRVDGGTWQESAMIPQSGLTYVGEIPQQEYGVLIEYYISANDTYGWTSVYPADMSYLSYVVDDTIDPLLSVVSPENNSDVSGVVTITAEASDAGSGLAFVEMYVDESLVFNETTGPFVCQWNTTETEDRVYTIRVYAHDAAGNMVGVQVFVNVTNAVTTTTTTTTTTTSTTTTTTTPPTSTTSTTTTSTTTTTMTTPDGAMLLVVALGGGCAVVILVVLLALRRKGATS